jgi:hypothetical protein
MAEPLAALAFALGFAGWWPCARWMSRSLAERLTRDDERRKSLQEMADALEPIEAGIDSMPQPEDQPDVSDSGTWIATSGMLHTFERDWKGHWLESTRSEPALVALFEDVAHQHHDVIDVFADHGVEPTVRALGPLKDSVEDLRRTARVKASVASDHAVGHPATTG